MRNALGIAIAAALMGCAPAAAQMRGARVMSRIGSVRMAPRALPFAGARPASPPVRVIYVHPAPVSPARPIISRPPVQRNMFSTSASTTTVEPSNSAFAPFGGTPIPLGQLLNPVPGLGFDYTHLAAINSGLAVRSFIDPITEHELATVESLPEEAPVGVGVGFFPAFSAEGPEVVGAAQPQIIVLQQPVPETARVAPAAARSAPAAAIPATPPLPVGVLYLVRRDGTTINAIAFSQQKGEVIYITADGVRHTIAVSDLDIKATEQRNAEHGALVHLTA